MKYNEVLEKVIRNCAKKAGIQNEEWIVATINKFKNVPPRATMKILTTKILERFGNNQDVQFQNMVKQIFELNDGSYKNSEELVNEIVIEQKESLENNHQIVNESLQEVCNKFNELGIDYYIVGALPVYLQMGIMKREHEDIDFFVAEKDLPKVAQALASTKYKFHDYRLDSPRVYGEDGKLTCGDHEVVADRDDNPFHLGFFLFKREKDGSVTQREYHARVDEHGAKIPVLFTRTIAKEKFELNYGSEPVRYLNTQFRASTPESVYDIKLYMLKNGFRKKDSVDVDEWKQAKKANSNLELINEDRLNKMARIDREHPTTEPQTRDVSAELIERIKQQQKEIKSLGNDVTLER